VGLSPINDREVRQDSASYADHLMISCSGENQWKVIDVLATETVNIKPLMADAYPLAEFD
jgi:hypothetical protein